MSAKRVSIITVTYNAASTLEACIESVLALKGEDVEFVVIDGGSKDGTVEILERYGMAIDVVVSEPDKGIYDAMNKGLDRASGNYVLFLGADDVLLHIPRQELSQGADLVLGDVDCDGWTFRHLRPETSLRKRMRYRNAIHPQGAFYRPSNVRYSLDYRCCADYLYNLMTLNASKKVVFCDEVVSKFSTEGASSQWMAKYEIISIVMKQEGLLLACRSFAIHFASHWLTVIKKRRLRAD